MVQAPPPDETPWVYDVIADAYAARRRVAPLDGALARLFDGFVGAVPPGGLVADLGCGHGFEAEVMSARGLRVVGLDRSAAMLRHAGARAPGRVVRADARALPLADGVLDGLWSSFALVHLPEPGLRTALAEVARVVRPGAPVALALALGEGTVREEVAYAPGHFRTFVRHRYADLRDLLAATAIRPVDGGEVAEPGRRGMVWTLARRQ